MKHIIIVILLTLLSVDVFAGTPAEDLICSYDGVKGARNIEVKGSRIKLARPILKKYPIGPMADLVTEVEVLNMGKAAEQDRQRFLEDLSNTLSHYRYYGKSDSPNGLVDVYVHLQTEEVVDELVIFNPDSLVLNILFGDFSVEDLLKLGSKPAN